ncbi:MAG: hypothetical protein AB8B48_09710 [Pseudomonadales bacterium]
MSSVTIIWLVASLVYALFWWWYVGFNRKLTAEEVNGFIERLANGSSDSDQIEMMRVFLGKDDGKEFVMVNLLSLFKDANGSSDEARQVLNDYQKPFLTEVLKRGGHPMLVSRAVGSSVELWGTAEENRNWGSLGLIRYRSRRDLIECLLLPAFQGTHHFKQKALEKTFAFPSQLMLHPTSPRWVVLLLVITLALATQLIVS